MDYNSNNSFLVVNNKQRRITMIEKLKTINPYDETEIDMDANSVAGLVYENTPLVQKINELVDAVNELQTKVNKLASNINFAQPEVKENVQDKFAEQRKWIGKLCWFWDIQEEYKFVGILGEVADNGTYFQKDGIVSYLNCEPVKPDDDIIYKGGNNE